MSAEALVFDSFTEGQEIPAFVRTVSAKAIDDFCHTWGEDNPIYLSDEAARQAGFEGRVAPPMMVRNYAHIQNVLTVLDRALPAHSIHVQGEYSFINPVRPGDTISTTGKVVSKYVKRDRKYVSFEFISKNQKGQTVVINEHTSVWPR